MTGRPPIAIPRARLRARLHRLSLHARVTMLAAVAVGLAVALVSLAAYLTVRQQLYRNLDGSLRDRAQSAVSAFGNQAEVLRIPPAVMGAADVKIALLRDDGTLFIAEDTVPPPTGDQELQVARGEVPESTRTLRLADTRAPYRVVAVDAGDGVALVLAQSLGPVEQTLHNLGLVMWAVGVIGVIGAAVAGNAVARSGLRPLAQLTGAAEHVARTERLEPIPVAGTDEIARLAQAFNAMLAALAQSQDRQRRLVGDAGHELRTPLTSIRTNLDLLIQADRRGGLADEDRRQVLDDVRAQMDELTALIGDLTELARDTPQRPGLELIDFSNVVQDGIARVRRRAPGIHWDVGLASFPVWGDERLLGRAVTNLLDNAAKYTPAGGTVVVQLADGVLTVADSGPGIAEADLPHVFDRFYRSTEARGRPGSGLGLAIVKHAAEQHGGMVYAGNTPGGGARFTLWLPHADVPGRQSRTVQH